MRIVTLALLVSSVIGLYLAKDRFPGPTEIVSQSAGLARASVAELMPSTKVPLAQRLSDKSVELGAPIFIRIFKQSRELEVWIEDDEGTFVLFETYPICAFSGDLGPKLREGDLQAPEGFYHVAQSALLPTSRFHRAFNLGYPNAYDRVHGRTGSFLMVHGSCVSIGCYAMTDSGIEEIYQLAEQALNAGQPFFRVHVFPFRLSSEALDEKVAHPWFDFWMNLKEGYDHFETTGRPPDVNVTDGRYEFDAS